MNEVIYLDEQGNACSENDELYTVIDDITARLMKMSKEERIDWFRRTQHPHPINFDTEINGTVYSVSAHFNNAANESLLEKAERIILKKMQQISEHRFKVLKFNGGYGIIIVPTIYIISGCGKELYKH